MKNLISRQHYLGNIGLTQMTKTIDTISVPNSADEAAQAIAQLSSGVVVSLNPEIWFQLENDPNNKFVLFRENVRYVFADGIGIVISHLLGRGQRVKKVAGVDVLRSLIGICADRGLRCYFLGSSRNVMADFSRILATEYPSLRWASSDGYFSQEMAGCRIAAIKDFEPHFIFVGMGCPRQELFIVQCLEEHLDGVYFGVGGSFDVLSGSIKRAPRLMIKLGLEWLYRLLLEPSRLPRQVVLPKIVFLRTLALRRRLKDASCHDTDI